MDIVVARQMAVVIVAVDIVVDIAVVKQMAQQNMDMD